MVSQQQPSTAAPPPPPPVKKSKSPPLSLTTIHALDDDILREIFLRLPSLPSLVRAALTCHTFLDAVRSSPAFRCRFRALHPPPLLGLFLAIYEDATPGFAPVRRRSDPDFAAVVRGADFFLTRLPDEGEEAVPHWAIQGCRDGYVVLGNYETGKVAVYNPLTRALDLFPYPASKVCMDMYLEFHILFSEEDHDLFRVLCLSREAWGGRAAVFSPDTKEWQIFPWEDSDEDEYGDDHGTLVNGLLYWVVPGRATARVLDTATLQFSRIDLPPRVEGQATFTFRAGETKDGELCMACIAELSLVIWVWRTDDYGVKRWVLDKFPLEAIAAAAECSLEDHEAPKVVAITDGFVYLSSYQERNPASSCWFISFCLETSKLNKLCPTIHQPASTYPYIMAWPPSLLRNKQPSLSS